MQFRQAGANLVLADIDGAELAALANELGAGKGQIATLEMDAARPEDAATVVDVAADFGEIDFLVPAAGIYRTEPFSDMSDGNVRNINGHSKIAHLIIRRTI